MYVLLIYYRRTNSDGRLPDLLKPEEFTPGSYKMRFETEDYFNQTGRDCFYPFVEVSLIYLVIVTRGYYPC